MNNLSAQDLMPLISVVVALLIPVIPAFVLFKFLPTRVRARGPYTGLRINLEGAFAGYFLLVLAILAFLKTGVRPLDNEHQVWKVRGKVFLDQRDAPFDENKLVVSTRPNVTLTPEGDFTLYLVVKRERGGEDFPFLIVEYGDEYHARSLDLNKPRTDNEPVITWSRDPALKEVTVKESIVLKKKDAPPNEVEQEPEPYNPPAGGQQ